MILYLSKRTSSEAPTRFCFIVSKRVDKRATVRHRVKRRLREAVRKRLPELRSGYDVVIIGKSVLAMLDYQEYERALDDILGSARLFA